MTPQRSRRLYFINHTLQGRYIFHVFLLAALVAIALSGLFSLLSADALLISYQDQHLRMGNPHRLLADKLILCIWLTLIPGGSLIAFFVLRQTHRLAGPLFKVERALAAMSEGRLDDSLQLRPKDDGEEVVRQFNHANHFLITQITTMRQQAETLHTLASQLSPETAPKRPTDDTVQIPRAACDTLCHEIARLRECLNTFSLSEPE